MNPSEKHQHANESVVSTSTIEIITAIIVFVFGAVVTFGSYALGAGWTTDGPGAGYFPFYIGLLICISGIGVIAQSLLQKGKSDEPFVDREQMKRVLSVLIPAIVYVGAVQVFGLYVASAVYIALFMVVLGKYSWVKSIVIALAVNALFFMMFEVWFKVPLYKGSINLLSFLGY
jgi:hypothetical protein